MPMNTVRIGTIVALTWGTFWVYTSVAQAGTRVYTSRTYSSARGYHYNTRVYRTGSGYSPVTRAKADMMRANAIRAGAMRAAQAEKYRAHQNLKKTRAKMERDFDTSPKMSKAQTALTSA